MNQRKPSQEHLNARQFPVLESLFMDPKKTAGLLQQAVNEGLIDAGNLEAALKPFVEISRSNLEKAKKEQKDQYELQAQIIKTHLFTKLTTFTGGIQELRNILEPFCKANNLKLEPIPGAEIFNYSKTNFKPDWESKDGDYALSVTHSTITIYSKLRNRWVPFNK